MIFKARILSKGRVKKSLLLTNLDGPPPPKLAFGIMKKINPFFILMDSIHFKTDFRMKKIFKYPFCGTLEKQRQNLNECADPS